MSKEEIDILKRALAREKAARKAAEKILEKKSEELYAANKKLEQLIKEKTSELRGVFENIVDAYVVMDLWGNVLKMNDAAIKMLDFNHTKEDFNLLQLIDKDEINNVMNGFQILINNGSITNFQVKIRTKKSTQKLLDINASIIKNEANKPIAAQGIIRDITKLKSLESQKENLLKKLEKSNDELREYAHIVSHDLKSPLRSIYALVNWLKEDNQAILSDESQQNFLHIESTLEKMELLISNILEYSSLNGSSSKMVTIDTNILVKDILEMLYIPKHIKISIASKLPKVKGDKIKLQQLFQNLIGNAVKYIDKPKGSIKIDVRDTNDYFEFSISDNGIGIQKKYHQKIFKIFHSLNKRKESTGIGLSIVKKIVDMHKGEIWLKSQINVGTTFFFTLKK